MDDKLTQMDEQVATVAGEDLGGGLGVKGGGAAEAGGCGCEGGGGAEADGWVWGRQAALRQVGGCVGAEAGSVW